jgi:hypothetical protein
LKPIKYSWKTVAEESLPLRVRPERVPADVKKLIYEMEEEYIRRYNILVSNRAIYEQIFDNLSTELDGRAVTPEMLSSFFLSVRRSNEEYTQAE